ncbi:hypothetical protein PX554_17775 [Sphingomonas sp. H39-1-10]|uniref:hypothetical protein n=1 Tax=Sphingomonas TaxID=13687 RepID=UPI00088B27AA|nr:MULTISPECIES: hypothetical protein [Sphingomonas]MDF0489987.1 hypothetical protein [Sphingomonas pollutisoli]SDA36203.1 hypothetical protein SAMN03159340_03566 [Sphingomonas sp. NFR15]
MSGTPGATSAITIIPGGGGRIVADRLLDRPTLIANETDAFSANTLPRGSCGYAAAARPFTRLRGYDRSGRLAWSWDLAREQVALRLLGTGIDDCLSPDHAHLLVLIYGLAPGDLSFSEALQAQGVVALGPRHGFVRAKPKGAAEMFGNARRTSAIGWRPGAPATLDYEVDADVDGDVVKASTDFSTPLAR